MQRNEKKKRQKSKSQTIVQKIKKEMTRRKEFDKMMKASIINQSQTGSSQK